jgi:hypothetical protein
MFSDSSALQLASGTRVQVPAGATLISQRKQVPWFCWSSPLAHYSRGKMYLADWPTLCTAMKPRPSYGALDLLW